MKQRNWADHFIFERISDPDSQEMIPLRHDENRAARRGARLAETTAGTGVTVHFRAARPDRSEGVMSCRKAFGRAPFVRNSSVIFEKVRRPRCSSASPSGGIAALVAFVASPLSSATNGAALRVDGGVVRHPCDRLFPAAFTR